MATQDEVDRLASLDACWALLKPKYGPSSPTDEDQAPYLVALAHQAFAIGEALDQVRRLEEALASLLRSKSRAGAVAPDSVGVEVIDLLRDATLAVYRPYRAQRDLLKHITEPVLEALNRLGIKGRRRHRLSHPLVLAAAFVQMGIEARKLPSIGPLEMEAVVRLCEDRDEEFPAPLGGAERKKRYDAWRRLLWKARKLLPILEEVTNRKAS